MRSLCPLLLIMSLLWGSASGLSQSLGDMLTNWDPSWPKRMGITGLAYTQEQDYAVGRAEIMLGGLAVSESAIGGIENELTQVGAKADFWILPFWNVHAMVGSVDGQTVVTPAIPGIDAVEVNYEGTVFGAGTTLAYGQDAWFVSVTGIYTHTALDDGLEDIPAWLVSPKIGVRLAKFELWVGATYQNVTESQAGVFNVVNVGQADYDVELEAAEPWNGQLGIRYAVTDSLFLTVEAGLGNRQSLVGHLQWRF